MDEKKENELNTYIIPLNYKLDASLFGIEIKWRRFGESVVIGLIAFFLYFLSIYNYWIFRFQILDCGIYCYDYLIFNLYEWN